MTINRFRQGPDGEFEENEAGYYSGYQAGVAAGRMLPETIRALQQCVSDLNDASDRIKRHIASDDHSASGPQAFRPGPSTYSLNQARRLINDTIGLLESVLAKGR